VNPRNAWDLIASGDALTSGSSSPTLSSPRGPSLTQWRSINLWVKLKGFPTAARQSELTGGSTPTLTEFRQHRHLFSKRPHEVGVIQESEATVRELERFAEVISTLPDERVRWLDKKRWDVMRLNPCEIPLLSDAQ
jgi:hypothetical protein